MASPRRAVVRRPLAIGIADEVDGLRGRALHDLDVRAIRRIGSAGVVL
jgi:hypothetical protein